MDLKSIKQIATILKTEGIKEFEWKEGDFSLKMVRQSDQDPVEITKIKVQTPAIEKSAETIQLDESVKKGPAIGNRIITSPIVGTFYRAPSPKADPYIKEGDKVIQGQVLCILEAMKLMNELEAEYPCQIVKVLLENAQPVEFGESLFEVKPL
jgi:acetyl-CoA carboxylase biotin carboxyl carrier protein